MKQAVFILFLVITINFSVPSGETMYQRQRHLIENTAGINKRDVPADELLKQKVILYARGDVLLMRVIAIDVYYSAYNNTS